jgi:hypothetical protein
MKNSIYLSQKKSGNYVVSSYLEDAWTLISKNNTPKELFESVKGVPPFSTIIKAEYAQSQLKTTSSTYTKKDALKAFGLNATKANIRTYFEQL